MVLAAGVVVGRVLNSNAYWTVYNYVTILVTALRGMVLLRQKL